MYITYKIKNAIYKTDAYIRTYYTGAASPDYSSYDGYLSGVQKSILPANLVINTYTPLGAHTLGLTYSQIMSMDGIGWGKVILGDEQNGVSFFIQRIYINSANIQYRLLTIGFKDGIAVSDNTSPQFGGNDDYQNLYSLIRNDIQFFVNVNQYDINNKAEISTIKIFTDIRDTVIQPPNGGTLIPVGSPQNAFEPVSEAPDPLLPGDISDPYFSGGTSTTGGGGGSFEIQGDPIDFPELPTIGATQTGFLTIYNPTLLQIRELADYMWNGPFDLNNFKKIFNDPMDCIIGLSAIPVNIPETGAQEITVGNIVSTVSANVSAAQYIVLDCGSVEIKEYWGSCFDYSPYTKIELYLPFVGSIQLNTDEVTEARGIDYGTVESKASARTFTHIIKLNDVDYGDGKGSGTLKYPYLDKFGDATYTKTGWHIDEYGAWYRFADGIGPDTYFDNTFPLYENGVIYNFDDQGYLVEINFADEKAERVKKILEATAI